MEYSFSCIEHCVITGEEKDNAFALGFKRRGTWWKVESLNKPSGLFDEEWEQKLINIREFLFKTNLPAWHPPKKEGFFRHIVIRKSFQSNLLLVNLVTSSVGLKKFDRTSFVSFMLEQFGERIAGIQHTVNDNVADRAKIENGDSKLLYGNAKIEEKINDLRFEISMESFFQTNPLCAELLYNRAIDYLLSDAIDPDSVVLDLFCGTGTIAQLIAKRNTKFSIIGVDIVEEAIEDARRNTSINELKNVQFIALDVGKFLKENPDLEGKIAALILDPPRAGIAPKTLQKVINLGAKVIVYISCNPSTQARDTSLLIDAGYSLENYTLVDQFPHTGHIEAIAKFVKK
jgi:23S rRNA (uracil-5-)-methyltransferase RumA